MDFFEKIKQRPWNSHYYSVPERIPEWFTKYPTMLSLEEMRMLSWIAANTPLTGDVLDLGAFLGGSTVSLAHGLWSAHKKVTLHSFDVFEIDEVNKQRFYYSKGYGRYEGSDSLPIFKRLTSYFGDMIVAHKGDILNAFCPSEAPSIVFIDLSKTWQLNDYLLTEFFTRIRAGCIIVQQDLIYFGNPWLCSTMKKLEPKVSLLSYTQDYSAIYGVNEGLTEKDVWPCLARNTTQQEVCDAIRSTREYFPELRQREMMDALLASYTANPTAQAAWEFPNTSGINAKALDSRWAF